MIKEYIERNKAINELRDVYEYDYPTASGAFDEYATMLVPRVLNNIPTADVVEVVRCKDCKLFVDNQKAFVQYCRRECKNLIVKPNDFCSYGEKKEGNNNG